MRSFCKWIHACIDGVDVDILFIFSGGHADEVCGNIASNVDEGHP